MEDFVENLVAFIIFLVLPFFIIWGLLGVRFETSEQNISGIAYNVTNNGWISGNTHFSIRASVDTLVNENTESSYCLPPNSPYIALVNEAAENKDIKLSVKTTKAFAITAPWGCLDNVTVTKIE